MATFKQPISRMHGTVSVLVVDDHEPFRMAMRKLVEAAPGFETVGDVDSGELAVVATRDLNPDVVLMDVDMPGLGGIEAATQIKQERPSTVVVLVSATHPDDLPRQAAACPADEIIWKSSLRPALLGQIWRTKG